MNRHDERAKRRRDCLTLLLSMAELLTRNHNHYQASVLNKLADNIASGQPLSVLNTNDVWGGAGSVVDCSFLHGASPSDEAVAEESRFGELVIRLVDLLEQEGVATDLMKSRRKSYLFWRSQWERKAPGQ